MKKNQYIFMLIVFIMSTLLSVQSLTAEKKVSFDVNAGYSPTLLFTDDTIGDTFSPAGAQLSFAMFFLHKPYGNMGIEISTNWTMAKTMPTQSELVSHIIPLHLNYVYQYHFNTKLALHNHIGVGMNMFNLHHVQNNATLGLLELSTSVNVGTGLQIEISSGFYTEVGIAYIVSFPQDVIMHQLVPSLSFGYRF